jgi:hypothetical protein
VEVEFLDAIPPGLPKDEFFARLQRQIEDAMPRLLPESMRGRPSSAA